ncbi:delta-60 repeat domain-containing protein [Actinoplanes sp. TFC3]|uniref:delta-60 repeat domain-containing protein n=1 Tax=Actinoplanes sp. TFC3 TaxID=1710355 RepID=UPI000A990098|nr:delta-60 repeat domain-containing protein [Actinoplanes sp. TFC3]
MSLKRRLRPRPFTRVLVPAAVVSLTVAATAIPANAVYVPPTAAATLVTANPADNTPHAQNGSMRAFAQIGDIVYAGGSFTGIKASGATSWTAANNLIAYNVNTGALQTGFKPVLDGAVQTLAVSPDNKLIVGGSFGTVNGVARKNLVELDPSSGATVTSWAGRGDGGTVRRAIVRGNNLYIAGAFHWVNGTQHSLLARLNASTGAIDATFQIDASGARPYPNSTELVWGLDVAPDGKTVVAVGNFTKVNAAARNQVVLIDTTGTPAVADWSTDRYVAACASDAFPFYARDVDFADDGKSFAIVADGGESEGLAYCDTTARWETADRGTNVKATWVAETGRDSVTSLEYANNVVYVAGHFRWQNNNNGNDAKGDGGVDRYGVAALDAQNGRPLAWNPGRSPGSALPSGGTAWGAIVWELWKGPAGLFLGQDSDGLGNEYHGRLGYFPTAGGRTIAAQDAPTATSGYLYLGNGNGSVKKLTFNGTTLGAASTVSQPKLTSAKAAFALSTKVYWATTGNVLNVSTLSAGTLSVPWVGSGYNAWYKAGDMTGAFYLKGRMYYTTATGTALYYRYLTPDGSIVGDTEMTLPTSGIDWRTVRGMTWVNNKIVYGSADGSLRSVAFDPAAATAVAGPGSVLAAKTTALNWSNATLFFATN